MTMGPEISLNDSNEYFSLCAGKKRGFQPKCKNGQQMLLLAQ
jgi:hypothetical protein